MKNNIKLTHRIETRIDEKKFLELQEKLKYSKYQNISELLRDILYNKKIVTVTYDRSLDKLMEHLSAIRSELHAIGVNINQVTRDFNSESKPMQKVYYSMQIATIYQQVGKKVDELLSLIAKIGERWLQK